MPEVVCWLLFLTLHGEWNPREEDEKKEKEKGAAGRWGPGAKEVSSGTCLHTPG